MEIPAPYYPYLAKKFFFLITSKTEKQSIRILGIRREPDY